TALASSNLFVGLGQSVTLTAIVSSSSGSTVSGEAITFKDGASSLGTAILDANGHAALNTSFSVLGVHSITAIYAGDTSFIGSASAPLMQTVLNATSISIISGVPNPSTFGQTVTFTAKVSSTAGTPSQGTVTFMDGTKTIGTGSLDASGNATAAT